MPIDEKAPTWSEWRRFPNPRKGELLTAPLGAGCYELRVGTQLLLYGRSSFTAYRMTSLLPKPLGCGTRKSDRKRADVLKHLDQLEYRTLACRDDEEARDEENKLKARGRDYTHPE